ncbi:MAG: hypothetical protein OXJ64_13400, partial [Boseongicola sp.]|nr:hypothetical protein [Boseongicola sp.]
MVATDDQPGWGHDAARHDAVVVAAEEARRGFSFALLNQAVPCEVAGGRIIEADATAGWQPFGERIHFGPRQGDGIVRVRVRGAVGASRRDMQTLC